MPTKLPTRQPITGAVIAPLNASRPHVTTRLLALAALGVSVLLAAAAVWPGSTRHAATSLVPTRPKMATVSAATVRKVASIPPKYCGHTATSGKINTVIVISQENRTWSQTGLGFSPATMPFTHTLAAQCAYFTQDSEVIATDNSASEYVGAWTGYDSTITRVRKSCRPSTTCSYTGNNIFRVFRNAGIPHREYVEGAKAACSVLGNVPRHVPELYMTAPADRAACAKEVLPLSQFNFARPAPGFSFITPNLCHDGHDCSNTSVDAWLSSHLPALLSSRVYRGGHVLIELWWDESTPRPNLFACWSCHQSVPTAATTYAGESLLWLNLLGAPTSNLGAISTAPDLRPILGAQ